MKDVTGLILHLGKLIFFYSVFRRVASSSSFSYSFTISFTPCSLLFSSLSSSYSFTISFTPPTPPPSSSFFSSSSPPPSPPPLPPSPPPPSLCYLIPFQDVVVIFLFPISEAYVEYFSIFIHQQHIFVRRLFSLASIKIYFFLFGESLLPLSLSGVHRSFIPSFFPFIYISVTFTEWSYLYTSFELPVFFYVYPECENRARKTERKIQFSVRNVQNFIRSCLHFFLQERF